MFGIFVKGFRTEKPIAMTLIGPQNVKQELYPGSQGRSTKPAVQQAVDVIRGNIINILIQVLAYEL